MATANLNKMLVLSSSRSVVNFAALPILLSGECMHVTIIAAKAKAYGYSFAG